jgi:bifunctional DNA-binding transcriptional regulator/antitoxin component of YhaV-PrlF toxin-antitoxin module
MKHVKMDSKRRIVIPAKAKEFEPGDLFEISIDSTHHRLVLTRTEAARDWLKTLRQCPGNFPEIEPDQTLEPEISL